MYNEIVRIVNKALDGTTITREEVIKLFSVDYLSEEYFAILRAGRQFTAQLCDGEAEIHAHIGLDATPCPNDCKFCSFAASAKIFHGRNEFSEEQVLANARDFKNEVVNAIYLVTTETYDQEKFLHMARLVLDELDGAIPLIANVPDFDYDFAKEMKDIGIKGVYHVVRFGEGVVTRIPVERRLKTLQAAKDAGLVLGNCIDPIGPEHTPEEIADLIMLAREWEVGFSGAMRRNTIPNTMFAKYGNISYGRLAGYVAACALSTGTAIPGNCTHEPSQLCVQAGANIIWAERGSSPRDVTAETTRGLSVEDCRAIYRDTEWKVRESGSRYFS